MFLSRSIEEPKLTYTIPEFEPPGEGDDLGVAAGGCSEPVLPSFVELHSKANASFSNTMPVYDRFGDPAVMVKSMRRCKSSLPSVGGAGNCAVSEADDSGESSGGPMGPSPQPASALKARARGYMNPYVVHTPTSSVVQERDLAYNPCVLQAGKLEDSVSDEDGELDERGGGVSLEQGLGQLDLEALEEEAAQTYAQKCPDVSFAFLPPEILVMVFQLLDPISFNRVQQVCHSWRQVSLSRWLWRCRSHTKWHLIYRLTVACSDVCTKLIADAQLPRKYTRRIGFLKETLLEVEGHCESRSTDLQRMHYNNDCYFILVDILLEQLRESLDIIHSIMEFRAPLTVNFDILDLSLRRYLRQLKAMFPIPEVSPPKSSSKAPSSSSDSDGPRASPLATSLAPLPLRSIPEYPSGLIADAKAREIWEARVGKDRHACHFQWFFDNVLVKEFPVIQADERFRDFFTFFVNFPRDDLLTVYKWSVIIDQFGPYEHFAKNFSTYACNEGFLGLINSVEAEDHLSGVNMFLLRFSRKEPEKLTISCKLRINGRTVVRHRRKPLETSISSFIAQHFNASHFRPVQKKLEHTATRLERLDEYCGQMGYLIDDSM